MTDVPANNCNEVKQFLCHHVEPGQFTVLPDQMRRHMHHCAACSEFFSDLIILNGLLSRCAKSRANAADFAPKHMGSEVAPTPSTDNPMRPTAILADERNEPMFEIYGQSAPHLPAILQPAAVHTVTTAVFRNGIPEPVPHSEKPSLLWRAMKVTVAVAVCVAVAALCVQLPKPTKPVELPRHATLATEAGKAFDAEDYGKVITLAQQCFDNVEPVAVKLQKELESSGREIPNGMVSEKDRDELLSHGPLNDVAACYFYLGQAQRKLGHKEEAREAYTKAATFTCARVWDPTGEFFWAPADNTAHWLQVLSKNK